VVEEFAQMPTVNVSISRLNKFLPGVDIKKILQLLPFIGLDIEGVDSEVIRLEYNPNRPDFGIDYGIIRGLRGLLEIEVGIPNFSHARAGEYYVVHVDESVKSVRPFIVAIVAKNGKLDDETIKQLIAMQEDLHNGIGRRRLKASVGIHNLDVIKFPLIYRTVNQDFSFVPLDSTSNQTIRSILNFSDAGKEYSTILKKAKRYPILVDSEDSVVSFPPIINSSATKVNTHTRNLFVEVTGSNQKSVEDILAILAITLYDSGFQIQDVSICCSSDGTSVFYVPKMDPLYIDIDFNYVNTILGLDFEINEIVKYLGKSRLNANELATTTKIIRCTVPRYRIDILSPIDIVEEVAIGYGIYNIKPTIPPSSLTGAKSPLSKYFSIIRQTMVGLQMLEVMNSSLVSNKFRSELSGMGKPNKILRVDGTKSAEHEILRDTLLPSLLRTLSYNIHEEYPQKLFEIGKIFHRMDNNTISEYWSIGVIVAHNKANYTEIKSALQALLKIAFGKKVVTTVATHPFFISGRCANVKVDGHCVGIIGEIIPLAIDNFKIRVPVAAFELNLSKLPLQIADDIYISETT
jgi:phenylalanyl-tRNA synthetase beta chain